MSNDYRDPNVLSFMMQLVQQKHGDEIEMDFLDREAASLYDQFGDQLVSYFEPLLDDNKKREFDRLVEANTGQEKILEFLMTSITDLDIKIQQVLLGFRDKYLNS